MKRITLNINGKRWQYERPSRIRFEGHACDGICDHEDRVIKVQKSLDGFIELETNLHEVEHAIGSFLDEEFVKVKAVVTAKFLWDLGYRKLTPDELKTHPGK